MPRGSRSPTARRVDKGELLFESKKNDADAEARDSPPMALPSPVILAAAYHDVFPVHVAATVLAICLALVFHICMPTRSAQFTIGLACIFLLTRTALHTEGSQREQQLGIRLWISCLYIHCVIALWQAFTMHGQLSPLAPNSSTPLVYSLVLGPVQLACGMLHGSHFMPTRWSIISSMPFVAKTIATHFLHTQLFIESAFDDRRVVCLVAVVGVLSFYAGLFCVTALGELRQRALHQQSLVQHLQRRRLEQLESEKERMCYDLSIAQKKLVLSGWEQTGSTVGTNSEIAGYLAAGAGTQQAHHPSGHRSGPRAGYEAHRQLLAGGLSRADQSVHQSISPDLGQGLVAGREDHSHRPLLSSDVAGRPERRAAPPPSRGPIEPGHHSTNQFNSPSSGGMARRAAALFGRAR